MSFVNTFADEISSCRYVYCNEVVDIGDHTLMTSPKMASG